MKTSERVVAPAVVDRAEGLLHHLVADRHRLKALVYSHTAGYQQVIRARIVRDAPTGHPPTAARSHRESAEARSARSTTSTARTPGTSPTATTTSWPTGSPTSSPWSWAKRSRNAASRSTPSAVPAANSARTGAHGGTAVREFRVRATDSPGAHITLGQGPYTSTSRSSPRGGAPSWPRYARGWVQWLRLHLLAFHAVTATATVRCVNRFCMYGAPNRTIYTVWLSWIDAAGNPQMRETSARIARLQAMGVRDTRGRRRTDTHPIPGRTAEPLHRRHSLHPHHGPSGHLIKSASPRAQAYVAAGQHVVQIQRRSSVDFGA